LFAKEQQRQQEKANKTGKLFQTESDLEDASMKALLQSVPIEDSEQLIPASEGPKFCEWISLMVKKIKEF
jgi:hypothetical protein